MNASLRTVPHSIHEDEGQKLGEDYSHFWTNQLVSDHLSKESSRLLPDRWVL